MSETTVSNDRGALRLGLVMHCEGCNGLQVFDPENIALILIHGDLVDVNFSCKTCRQQMCRPADAVRQELVHAGISALELGAGCPGLQRGVWVVPATPALPPELITDSESAYVDSRFS